MEETRGIVERNGLGRALLGTLAALALVLALSLGVAPTDARAGSYEVVSCDAAGALQGWISHGWQEAHTRGRAYIDCPTSGDGLKGISNRIVNERVPNLSYSIYSFQAPPGATIRSIQWAGRMARDNCDWTTALVANPGWVNVLGLPAHSRCPNSSFDLRLNPIKVDLPAGSTSISQLVQCNASSCGPGATAHTTQARIIVDDPHGPSIDEVSGALASGQWVAGQQAIHVTASDNVGIDRLRAEVPGIAPSVVQFPCASANARHCPITPAADNPVIQTSLIEDGVHPLTVTAIDAAGNGSTASRNIRVDNNPPETLRPVVSGGEDWRRDNRFDIGWTSTAESYAPIQRVHWEVCSAEGSCEHHAAEATSVLGGISVTRAGDHPLRVWLEDAAGNQRKPPNHDAVHLRYDPVAPSLGFEPQDPSDPLRVAVSVHDEHSGLGDGEIEIRRTRSETWHALATKAIGSKLVAHVDDERFRNGSYEFRAHAVDRAGNEASTGRLLDGRGASIRLPVRIATLLRVGVPKRLIGRRVIRREGRRRVIRRRRTVLKAHARVGFRERIRLRGRLTNPDGQPIDEATIGVFESIGDKPFSLIGTSVADKRGLFTYSGRALRSRVLRFRYPGSRRIRSATRDVRIDVPAESTIKVSRPTLRNGHAVTFSGRVRTTPIPREGKLVEIQAFFRARYRTISTVRSDHGGRWRFPYRFGATAGRVRYRFRVRLPYEGGYPFATGTSSSTEVTVIGF